MNPKDQQGNKKPSFDAIPPSFLLLLGRVMSGEKGGGAAEYGKFNWREPGNEIKYSVYVNAIHRHLAQWEDGEDCCKKTTLHHLAHIAGSCCVVIDAMLHDNVIDDRMGSGVFCNLLDGLVENSNTPDKENR